MGKNYNKKISDTNIRIGEVRFSYCNVFTPRAGQNGGEEKYSVCVIIPASDKATVDLINEAIEAAKLKGKAEKWGGKVPANCKIPLRDGDLDREDDEAFAGCLFLNATTKIKPGVKTMDGGKLGDAFDGEDFYSGCYGAATLNFFPYDSNGNRGVGVGLNNVVKTRDGERLSGGRSADEDFADLED